MICTNCNEEIPRTAKVCGFCGHRVQEQREIAAAVAVPAVPTVEAEQSTRPAAVDGEGERAPADTTAELPRDGSVPPPQPDSTTYATTGRGPLVVRIWSRSAALGSLLILLSLALPWVGLDGERMQPSRIVDRFFHTTFTTPRLGPYGHLDFLWSNRLFNPDGTGIHAGYVVLLFGILGVVSMLSPRRAWMARVVGLLTITFAMVYVWRWVDIVDRFDILFIHVPATGLVLAIVGGFLLLFARYSKPVGEN